ncbi:MAG: MBL fold metallo-hydrolase [Clostridia bacterium]
MKICTLFSGSRGNATLIQCNNTNILVDCGVNYRYICKSLEKLNLKPASIDAIFVTHSHSDHIAGIFQFVMYNPTVDIFVHANGAEEFYGKTRFQAHTFNGRLQYKNIAVDIYQCMHDVTWCTGYKFTYQDSVACIVTDTGSVDDQLVDFLRGCKALVIESNHDINMLKCGNYPPFLKQRIASCEGHLSNDQTAGLLERILGYGTQNIILAHLSEQNNTPTLAKDKAISVASKLHTAVNIYVGEQNQISEVIEC